MYLKHIISLPYQRGSVVEIFIEVDRMNVKINLTRCALVNFDSPD